MVVSCCAFNCKERFVKGGLLKFHSFPKDESRRKLWTLNVRRADFVPTASSKLCSKHFTEDCFDREKFGGTWLKKDAVPTIFGYPEHLPKRPKRKLPKERSLGIDVIPSTSDVQDLEAITVPVCDMPMTSQIGISDINTALTTSNRKRKMYRFPTNQALREKWTKALRRLNYKPTEYSKLCAKHFTPDCYETAPWSFMKRLKEGAAPTIFEFSPISKRKSQKKSVEDQEKCKQRKPEKLDEETGKITSSIINSNIPVGRKGRNVTGQKSAKRKEDGKQETKYTKTKFIELNVSSVPLQMTEELNVDSSYKISSEHNLASYEVEMTPEIISYGNVSSLPAKRCRKKKIFFGDFISEDCTWKGKRKKGIKTIQKEVIEIALTENKVSEASQTQDHNLTKSSEESSENLEASSSTAKENHSSVSETTIPKVSSDHSSVCDQNNYTLEKSDSDADIISETEFIPLEGPYHHSSIKFLAEGDNLKSTNSRKKTNEGPIISQDESVKVINASSNNSEQSCTMIKKQLYLQSVSEVPLIVNNERNTENIIEAVEGQNKEAMKLGSNYNDCIRSHLVVPSVSISSEKISSILKLNLDEEEALLKKCIIYGKDNEKGKLVSLKKVAAANKDDATTPSNEECITSLNYLKRKSYIGDFKVEDLVSPENAAKCLKTAQNVIREKDKKIKYLRQRERRLMKKVEELECVIFHLVEKKMNPEEASTVLIVLKDND